MSIDIEVEIEFDCVSCRDSGIASGDISIDVRDHLGQIIYEGCKFRNNATYGVNAGVGQLFLNCEFTNNVNGVSSTSSGDYDSAQLRNCVFSGNTNEYTFSNASFGYLKSFNHNGVSGDFRNTTYGGTTVWQTAVKQGSDPGAWQVQLTGSNFRQLYRPVLIKLAEILVTAGDNVSVQVWVSKSHATNIGGAVFIQDGAYSLTGVAEELSVKADNLSWEQLEVTCTPTETGVLPIWGSAWNVANIGSVYFGSIVVTIT